MNQSSPGKIKHSDERTARVLAWTPWLSFILVTLPLPVIFLLLFAAAATTDSAAIFLLLSFVSLGAGLVVGAVLLILLMLYRRRWQARLRDRLATDGITADEVPWFSIELSSEERAVWGDLKQKNPMLADAYCETLAARLTATRIVARSRGAILKVERQITRTRNLAGIDTSSLLNDLNSDRQRFDLIRSEAAVRLSEAKARLQTIEAAANRSLSETETELMLRRLTAAQEQFPLALEILNLEQEALGQTDTERFLNSGPSDQK
ncbi:MAG TPA: hypothetical protein DC047_16560 [Blastocatellia bacterium]|nr:hypothetical protein [Blastocatellia bacterium]